MAQAGRGAQILVAYYPFSTGAQRALFASDEYDSYDTWAAEPDTRAWGKGTTWKGGGDEHLPDKDSTGH